MSCCNCNDVRDLTAKLNQLITAYNNHLHNLNSQSQAYIYHESEVDRIPVPPLDLKDTHV